jgi:hypothetical protein
MGKIKIHEENYFNKKIGKHFKFINKTEGDKERYWLEHNGYTYLGELRKSGKV